jgi:hypothetical protein
MHITNNTDITWNFPMSGLLKPSFMLLALTYIYAQLNILTEQK